MQRVQRAGSHRLPAFLFHHGVESIGMIQATLRLVLSVGMISALTSSVRAWETAEKQTLICDTRTDRSVAHPVDGTGGIHITSVGTLRVLVVFASFPDDETPHPFWPAHNPPLFMQEFIDPDTTSHSQGTFNLTNYFSHMSLGQFHLVGEAVWVETPHSQEEYRNGSFGRANMNVLQERVDSIVDFTRYDSWTTDGDYVHRNVPDGQVDMIIMVWRTNMWQMLGEASLGYRPGYVLDGKRIETGFPEYLPFPLGSGVTCVYPYSDSPYGVMQTMVHELSHWLLGGPHPYDNSTPAGKHAYWGMLCNPQRVSSCINSYERERLGWAVVPEIVPDVDVVLPDYLSSGVALKYHPANGDPFEYFYFENHQLNSVFDDVTANASDRGLWVLHQDGPYMEMDNLKVTPSDGIWNWENPGSTMACFSQQLPEFTRGEPRVVTGQSHRDQIPTLTSAANWMSVLRDEYGVLQCGNFFSGHGFIGAFTPEVNPVFSQFSNPGTFTWNNQTTPFSFVITGETGGVLTARWNSNPADGPPAKRYLGRNPALQRACQGSLTLAWGPQWPEGQPLEPNVNWSELDRKVGYAGSWETIYHGSQTLATDSSLLYDSLGTVPVFFRARVRNTQGVFSAWSNILYAKTISSTPVAGEHPLDRRYKLNENYPNPFNPSTTITFSIPRKEFVSLEVFDLIGRLVATLVKEEMQAGNYTVEWDGRDKYHEAVAGGIYFCRMQAGPFSALKKMVLMK